MKTQAIVLGEIVVEFGALVALAAGLLLAVNATLDDPATLIGQDGILPAILLAVALVGFVFLDIQSARRR
jgi:hypothetical protein